MTSNWGPMLRIIAACVILLAGLAVLDGVIR